MCIKTTFSLFTHVYLHTQKIKWFSYVWTCCWFFLHNWYHIIYAALEVVFLLNDLFLRFSFHVDSCQLNSLLLTSEYHSSDWQRHTLCAGKYSLSSGGLSAWRARARTSESRPESGCSLNPRFPTLRQAVQFPILCWTRCVSSPARRETPGQVPSHCCVLLIHWWD